MKRRISAFLVLALILSVLCPTFTVLAVDYTNTGARHELCTALSSKTAAYYTGENSFDRLITLRGKATNSSVTACGSELFNALQELMSRTLTKTVTYKSLTSYWPYTDASNGSDEAVLFYSDQISGSYNREHVWPKSRGSFYQSGAGSDLHHLRPTDSKVNSTRNHWTMGNVKASGTEYTTESYGGNTVLWIDSDYHANDCDGLVEVNENIKGDVARILLYVYVTYGKTTGENLNLFTKTSGSGSGNEANDGNKVIESLDTLLQWCQIDPVDTWEMSRNDCVQLIQGNRNVFIDYPELAWRLFERDIPGAMPTPSHYATEHASAYTSTAVSDNPAHGTVSGTNNCFTAYPAAGYYVSGYTLNPEGAAKVTRSGNTFYLTELTANCELTVHFAENEKATASFATPEGVVCTPIEAYVGDPITLPGLTLPEELSAYHFVGWTLTQVEADTQEPEYWKAGSTYVLAQPNTVFYALLSYLEAGAGEDTGEYHLTDSVQDGSYVIAAPSKSVMMNTTAVSGTALGGDSAKLANDVISNAAKSNVFTIHAVGDYYAIVDESGHPLTYVGAKSIKLDGDKEQVTESDDACLWAISVDSQKNAKITPKAADTGSLQYNANSPRFTVYTSAQTPIALYSGVNGTRYYTTQLSAQPHTHSWDEGVVTVAPTCVEAGEITYTCTVCGETRKEELPALGHKDENDDGKCDVCGELFGPHTHSWDEGVITVEPTCLEVGEITYTCTVCGEARKEELPALGHDWGEGVVTREPALWEAGELTRTCSRCGETETEEIPALTSCGGGEHCPSNRFVDVAGPADWTHIGIDFCIHSGLMAGTSETTFEPQTSTSRAMIVSILYRLAGSPETDYAPVFTDVADSQWYTKGVIWASENGIAAGYGGGVFGPNDSITREQLAAILLRYASFTGEQPGELADLTEFTDVASISDWALVSLRWAVAQGLIHGKDNACLDPLGNATRAEVAAILMRYIQR